MKKFRMFTFALTIEDTPNIEQIIDIVQKYPKYAYILHDSDLLDDGTPKKDHYHFYVEFPNPRSFQSIANDLSIATNFIEKVYDKSSILLYLTHKNRPEKYQYSDSDIESNFSIDEELTQKSSLSTIYEDFKNLRYGMIDADIFIDKYSTECNNMSFYNKLRTIDMVCRADHAQRVTLNYDTPTFKPADYDSTESV